MWSYAKFMPAIAIDWMWVARPQVAEFEFKTEKGHSKSSGKSSKFRSCALPPTLFPWGWLDCSWSMPERRHASLPNSHTCRVVAASHFWESYLAVDWLAVGSISVHHVRHDARTCSLFYGGCGRRTLAFACIPWSELDASQHCFLYTHMWSGGVVWSRLCIHCSSTSWIELEQSCWTLATWINGISRGFYYGRHVNNSDALSF